MAEFNGKIDLDIRDSEPDWTPFLYSAEGAGEFAKHLIWSGDDIGIATWDCFGGSWLRCSLCRGDCRMQCAGCRSFAPPKDQGHPADRSQRHYRGQGHHRGMHRRIL